MDQTKDTTLEKRKLFLPGIHRFIRRRQIPYFAGGNLLKYVYNFRLCFHIPFSSLLLLICFVPFRFSNHFPDFSSSFYLPFPFFTLFLSSSLSWFPSFYLFPLSFFLYLSLFCGSTTHFNYSALTLFFSWDTWAFLKSVLYYPKQSYWILKDFGHRN